MDNPTFKKLFNVLYNNINNNAAPGLTDAEISIFLNKGLDEIIKSHVLGPTTTYQLGINQTSKRDVELNNLIITTTYQGTTGTKMHPNGVLCTPKYTAGKPLIVLSEVVRIGSALGINLDMVELSYALFNKFMAGVYKHPKKNQCWKLRHDNIIEFIPPVGVELDTDRIIQVYVKTPRLIVIDSVTESNNVTCELPEVLHPEILQRAVELAKAAYAAETLNVQMLMGQRSE